MNMKLKFFVAILLTLFIVSVQAQKINHILRVGVNLANVTTTNDGRFDESNTLTSFQFGLIGDIKLIPVLYLQPGILFTGKGSKVVNGNPDSDVSWYKATFNPYYIELPLNVVVKSPGKTRVFAGIGPYLGIGVAGKNKVEGKFLGTYFKTDKSIEFSDDDPTTLGYEEGAGAGIMKRIDYGINALAGVECHKAVFSFNYGHGLARIQSGTNNSSGDNDKHRVFSFTVGLRL